MENKYFTPDIEDIHVGYECEICPHLGYKDEWITVIGKCEEIPGNGVKDCNLDELTYDCLIDGYIGIRVPYLTKEQIEAEGWKFDRNQDDDDVISFEKKIKNKLYMLHFYPIKNQIIINDINSESLPLNCKDINTFRKICKLLEI